MLNIVCTQTIILAVHKIMCGKKGLEKKIFRCYMIQGVGMLNVIIMMIYHIASPKFLWSENFVIHAILP